MVELRAEERLETATERIFAAKVAAEYHRRFSFLWGHADADALELNVDLNDAAARERRNRALQAKVYHMAALCDVNECHLPFIADIDGGETRAAYFARLYKYFSIDAARLVPDDADIIERQIKYIHGSLMKICTHGNQPSHLSLSFWRDLLQCRTNGSEITVQFYCRLFECCCWLCPQRHQSRSAYSKQRNANKPPACVSTLLVLRTKYYSTILLLPRSIARRMTTISTVALAQGFWTSRERLFLLSMRLWQCWLLAVVLLVLKTLEFIGKLWPTHDS